MRILLCRPQGGLNDILNQIEKCHSYAIAWNRTLVVDTAYTETHYFQDEFSRYFSWQDDSVLLANLYSDEALNRLSVYPEFLAGRVHSYHVHRSETLKKFVDDVTGEPVTFDFSRDYSHELLIHQQGGGGLKSLNCLSKMRVNQSLRQALHKRLSKLPPAYPALHIRNTDLKTHYRQTISEIRSLSLSCLFLATDDSEVLDEFARSLPTMAVFSFSSLGKASTGTLHIGFDRSEAFGKNSDAILDLIMLSLGSPLLVAKVSNKTNGQYSGFSRLALALNRNPVVLRTLLSRP